MSEQIYLEATIPPTLRGQRLDKALGSLLPDYSRTRIQQWLKEGAVSIAGSTVTQARYSVLGEETVIIEATVTPHGNDAAEPIPLDIVFEDEALLIINKPAGLVCHPGAGNLDGTLVNALLNHAPSLESLPRAGLIHRLDKDTSGLLIVAKDWAAHQKLIKTMQAREISREYFTIVHGVVTGGGTIEAPIGRHRQKRTSMAVVPNGKPAVTHYRVIERFSAQTALSVKLETGRTHQIRVHMQHIHHPLVGDSQYGGKRLLPKGVSTELREKIASYPYQALHAQRLKFNHPLSHDPLQFSAELPKILTDLISDMRKDASLND